MEATLQDLLQECHRATGDLLSIRGWPCPKYKVEDAVTEIRLGTRFARSSTAWLFNQISKVPEQEQPARRLNDLVQAFAALRAFEAETEKSA